MKRYIMGKHISGKFYVRPIDWSGVWTNDMLLERGEAILLDDKTFAKSICDQLNYGYEIYTDKQLEDTRGVSINGRKRHK